MKENVYVLFAFVSLCLFVIWLECRENRVIDAKRERHFQKLEDSCLSYLRQTKDRPFWRIAWVCACLVTVGATVPFAACMKHCDIKIGAFCIMVFAISFVSAQAALSYYTWHILCPHYTCTLCGTEEGKVEKCIGEECASP